MLPQNEFFDTLLHPSSVKILNVVHVVNLHIIVGSQLLKKSAMNKSTEFITEIFEFGLQGTLLKTGIGDRTVNILLVALSVTLTSYLFTRNRWNVKKTEEKQKSKGLNDIIGPKQFPLLGNLFDFPYKFKEIETFIRDLGKKYAKRVRYNILGQNYVILYNAADIKQVLHTKNYIQKSAEYDGVFTWIEKGALTAHENLWLKTRPLLDLGFRQRMLNNYREVFCNKTMQLMTVLREKVSKDSNAFNIFPHLLDCGFDIISESVMNTPSNTLGGVVENIYSANMDRAGDFFHYLHFRPFFHKTAIGRFLWSISKDGKEKAKVLKNMNDFSENVIKNRKKVLEQEADQDIQNSTSLLDIMLLEQKTNPLWTDQQIRAEVDTFLTGGHGATTATFGMFIQLMAAHPDIQEKVYAEVSPLFDGDPSRELTLDDLSKLKYTEMCIKECLRLYPGVPFFPRGILRPLTLADGVVVPVKTTVLIVPFLLHRDPDIYPDPEKFIPDRFAPGIDRHPYSWIPFSKGPRDCIGKGFSMLEMKVYVAYIINNFRLIKVVNTEDMTVLLRVFLKPKNGIQIKLEPRN